MKKIAVTGGIATGKTTLLNLLKSMGFKTFSCDEVVKILYQKKEVQEAIRKIFGKEVFSTSKPDTIKILKAISEDEEKKKALESILHPLVKKELKGFLEDSQKQGEKIVFVEVPLLFEVGWEKDFDEVWVVWCKESTQKKRILERGKSAEYLLKLKEKQLPLEKKIQFAHRAFSSEEPISILKKKLAKAIKI